MSRRINVTVLMVLSGLGLWVAVGRGEVPVTTRRSDVALPLTEAEEKDLERFVPQMLKWSARWLIEPLSCGDGLEINVADEIKRYEGRQIEGRLFVSHDNVIVFFDTIHLVLRYRRLHRWGLSPPEFEDFCGRDYREYVLMQQRRGKFIGEGVWQSRSFHLGKLFEPVMAEAQWDEEKKQLYARLIEVVRRQAQLHCEPQRKTVRAKIPDCEIGDPYTVVLFDAAAEERPAAIIAFDRDEESGTFEAKFAKDFGLPDELAALKAALKRQLVREVEFDCGEQRGEKKPGELSEEVKWVSERELLSLVQQRTEPEDVGEHGEVVVMILVGADGRVLNAYPLAGPSGLWQAAVKAAYKWRFKPRGRKLMGEVRFEFR